MAMNRSLTREWRRLAGGVFLLIAGLALSGCSVAHMKLPQGLEGHSTALDVEGLGSSFITKKIKFGPYQVTGIKRGWTKGAGWSAGGYSRSKAKQHYEFDVSGPGGGKVHAQCVAGARWSKQDTDRFFGANITIQLTSTEQLICNLTPEGGGKGGKLFLSQNARAGEDVLSGVMLDGNTRIDVAGTHKLGATPLPLGDPTGYYFMIGDRPAGAVEVINMGTVWLSNSENPATRSALAVTAAIMLLYQDVKKQIER